MNSERLTTLFSYLENDPNDAFIKYAIALEYMKHDPVKSLQWLEDLLSNHPEYLPTYYQAGKMLQANNQSEKAQNIFEKGIKLAIMQKNHLTQRELNNALNEMLFDDE